MCSSDLKKAFVMTSILYRIVFCSRSYHRSLSLSLSLSHTHTLSLSLKESISGYRSIAIQRLNGRMSLCLSLSHTHSLSLIESISGYRAIAIQRLNRECHLATGTILNRYICLSVCPCLCFCFSLCLCFSLYISRSVPLIVGLSVSVSLCLYLSLYLLLSVSLSLFLSVYISLGRMPYCYGNYPQWITFIYREYFFLLYLKGSVRQFYLVGPRKCLQLRFSVSFFFL